MTAKIFIDSSQLKNIFAMAMNILWFYHQWNWVFLLIAC